MKIFHIILIFAICTLIICTNTCFASNFWGKNHKEVTESAKKEFDNYNYGKAINLYKQALWLKTENLDDIYLHIGISYIGLDKYKKAISPLTKSIEINPNNSSPYYNRGYAYYKIKQTEKAKQDFKKALEINKPVYPYEIKEAKELLEHIEYLDSCE